MLTGSNNRALTYRNINPELMFFYQRWQELLETRTLDMYQYNILNACVACLELQDVIEKTLNGLLLSRQNVDDIKDEALEIMKYDDILKKHDIKLWITLMRILSSKVGKKRSDASDSDVENFHIHLLRLKYELSTPCRILCRKYKGYIIEELINEVKNQNFILIEKYASSLISQCINEGWSAKGLFNLSNILRVMVPWMKK